MFEGLSRAMYTVTPEYVEEQYGLIYKRLRQIPLNYVQDLTSTQNFIQAMFGLSSITVTPTNGHKIVISNIRAGKKAQETIWRKILQKSGSIDTQQGQ